MVRHNVAVVGWLLGAIGILGVMVLFLVHIYSEPGGGRPVAILLSAALVGALMAVGPTIYETLKWKWGGER